MKKYSVYLLITSALVALSLLTTSQKPQTRQDEFRAKQLIKYERFLGVTDDSIAYSLYLLSQKGEHQVVIDHCKSLILQSPGERQYHAFLASSYYNLQQQDSATYYALRYLKQQVINGNINLNDPLMFSKYPTFFPIGNDTVLQKKMLQVYLDDYRQKGYPNTGLGIRLIELAYQDQYTRNMLSFRFIRCNDSSEVATVQNRFWHFDEENDRHFLQLYKDHPEYITVREVGEEAGGYCQAILISHTLDSSSRNGVILPMLRRAVERQEYSADSYVGDCVYVLMREQQYEKAHQVYDSLCKIYQCKNPVKWE